MKSHAAKKRTINVPQADIKVLRGMVSEHAGLPEVSKRIRHLKIRIAELGKERRRNANDGMRKKLSGENELLIAELGKLQEQAQILTANFEYAKRQLQIIHDSKNGHGR
ncbi:MAG: hypothetical protein NUV67_03490 [archaeon]|nr:hypothetical protein [archaeon]